MPDPVTPTTNNEGETPPATSAGGQATTPPATGQPAPPPTTPRTFTQQEVDTLMGTTRAEARDRATTATLSDLGFENAEAAKTAMAAWKQHQTDQLSELEQAQLKVTELSGATDQLAAKDKEVKALNTLIEAQVKAQIELMEVPDHILPLLDAMPVPERLAYLTEHGANFTKQPTTPMPKTNAGGKGGGNAGDEAKARRKRIHTRYSIL